MMRKCVNCDNEFKTSPSRKKRYCSKQCRSEYIVKNIELRFWSKVNKTETCWLWADATSISGYGKFRNGHATVSAHRTSYELTYGPIPEGLLVCHKCDNPPCVRPDHLFLGTAQDNMDDMVTKNRVNRWRLLITHCPHGHPYLGDNLVLTLKGNRLCLTCQKVRDEEKRKKRQLEKQRQLDEGLITKRITKIHCPYGHPYSQENTYIQHGIKVCRTCRRLQDGKRRKQKNQYNRERYRKKMQSLKSIITQDL